jgi:hypothetical protein
MDGLREGSGGDANADDQHPYDKGRGRGVIQRGNLVSALKKKNDQTDDAELVTKYLAGEGGAKVQSAVASKGAAFARTSAWSWYVSKNYPDGESEYQGTMNNYLIAYRAINGAGATPDPRVKGQEQAAQLCNIRYDETTDQLVRDTSRGAVTEKDHLNPPRRVNVTAQREVNGSRVGFYSDSLSANNGDTVHFSFDWEGEEVTAKLTGPGVDLDVSQHKEGCSFDLSGLGQFTLTVTNAAGRASASLTISQASSEKKTVDGSVTEVGSNYFVLGGVTIRTDYKTAMTKGGEEYHGSLYLGWGASATGVVMDGGWLLAESVDVRA